MLDRIAQWQPDQGAAVAARAVGALALATLAVIHVLDLPGTLGPTPLVGIGYLGIIAAAILIGGVLIARPHRLAWAAAAAVAASAMIGYVLTRGLRGGFLGDHGDVGNWHCPLGIAALSVESVIILLVLLVALGAWQARIHAASVAAAPRAPAQRVSEYNAYLRTTAVGGVASVIWRGLTRTPVNLSYSMDLGRTEAQPALFCAVFNLCEATERERVQRTQQLAVLSLAVTRDNSNSLLSPTRGSIRCGVTPRYPSPDTRLMPSTTERPVPIMLPAAAIPV